MAAPLGLETREQRAIFVTYMGLWVSYGLLNELAKRNHVTFNATAATPESDQKMIDGMGACRPYVLLIWAGVAISAFLGVLKPGQGPIG